MVELIGIIADILLALYLLYSKIGELVYITIIGMIVIGGVNMLATIHSMKIYRSIATIKDKRISLTTDVITGIKSIKYLSWERLFSDKILKIREDEYN